MGGYRLSWDGFHRWSDDALAIDLWHSEAMMLQIVPKRALAPGDADAMRGLAAAAGLRGASRG